MIPLSKRLTVLLFFFMAASILAGCKPKVHPWPENGVKAPERFQNHEEAIQFDTLEDHWWEEFGDPDINELVNRVLKNNLDIKTASARIDEIKAYFVQTKADRMPLIGIKAQAQRQKTAGYYTMPGADQKNDLFNLSFPASFEIDLWGRLSSAQKAARADLLQTEETRLTLINSIIAESISLYLTLESLERRVQLAHQTIDSYRNNFDIISNRYKRGISSFLDVKQSAGSLAQAESALPALNQELSIVQQKLSVIAGEYPKTSPVRKKKDDYFKYHAPLEPGMPSDLLLRRPDIRAAHARLTSLQERIHVAKASRFPQISLTGNFGYASPDLDNLFKPEAELWNLAMGISRPLFDAGRLKANQRSAEAKFAQGIQEYAKTVLTAFFEVESALVIRKNQLEKRERMLTLLRESKETQTVAELHYEKGLIDYPAVLQARQVRYQAEEGLIMTDLAILTNRVTLCRALGAGFPDPIPE
ncbi:MAG: efflux transporter outer membrane subunit [Proteobacteria bacterium]|nr:efflux transporter outer membrane subunit [Pseudomonadota bacterium]